ncbi:MAG: N-acyl-D-amino-acid deacylase family protein [Acidobacteriota bacterium]
MLDLVVKGARVADGSGAPLIAADVGVADGRVVAFGKLAEPARETVAADGLVLAPGIVDVHTHYDAQLTWEARCSPSPALGVTTVVIGNCGFSIAPCPPGQRDLVARNLSEVEGMSLDALRAGIDWHFESYGDYLELVERKGMVPNVAGFVGHSTVRTAVMGGAASERAATADEIAAMRRLVAAAIAAGAIGFASSSSENHSGYGGVPMPSRLAEEVELLALAGVLGEAGRGVFQMTVGPRTPVALLERIARETGRTAVFSSVFQNDAFPERGPGQLADCAAAQARGARVFGQVSCQPLTMEFTLANPYPFHSLDAWAPLKGAPAERIAAALRDPEFRARFRTSLATPKRGTIFYGNWARLQVAEVARAEQRTAEGRSIAELAATAGRDPLDFFFDFGLAEELRTVFVGQLVNADEAKLEPLLRDPCAVVALSDAGAHLSLMCDAGFGLHLLGHWTRERKSFTLPEAVRRLTADPAGIYGIRDRGRIAPGHAADLLLFDPETVGVSRIRRQADLPGGGTRMIRDPQGVQGVWVNGVRVFDGKDYVPQKRTPGKLLRDAGVAIPT